MKSSGQKNRMKNMKKNDRDHRPQKNGKFNSAYLNGSRFATEFPENNDFSSDRFQICSVPVLNERKSYSVSMSFVPENNFTYQYFLFTVIFLREIYGYYLAYRRNIPTIVETAKNFGEGGTGTV